VASYARRFIASGVRLVGGCCGTTPEHIRQICAAVRHVSPAETRATAQTHVRVSVVAEAPHAQPPVPRADKSHLAAALASGKNVVSVELIPPRGVSCEEAMADARALAALDIDALTVFEVPRGARMTAMSLAVLLQQHAGLETAVQYSCRDKNLLAIQSDLLGAAAMGLRNIVGITGAVNLQGEIPDATAVYEVDSIGLTNVMTRLNHGLDVGGQPIGEPTALHVGVMVNPGTDDIGRELRRFEYKVEAGAEFAITSPIFDIGVFERFLARVEAFRIPILVGLWPFDSLRHAEYMANEVPGITVPDSLLGRLRATFDEASAAAEGIRIAQELGARLRPMAQGVHISSPAGKTAAAVAVLEHLR
jgi:homocysteine S-methyltransferase